ncbi:lipopolysaccharide heptosyltransferase II [Arcobacter sp. 15-2]|uniref:glycosyltransferase family 9 protein n=1 Tax=Arcobacter sp. 15-2 TaxID=3374109 RepID=UPI00399C7607
MRILVIHTFGLGDMIMFTPALKNIINKFPDVKIDFLVLQKVSIAPINNCTNIDQLYFFENGILPNLKLMSNLRANSYDYILHTSGTSILKMSLMMLLLKGKQKVGEYEQVKVPWYKKQTQRLDNKHRVESNIEIANLITIDNSSKETPCFYLNEDNCKFADDYVSKFKDKILIGIHPGCNEKFANKRWEIEKYIELIKKLNNKNKDIKFFIFIGPDEKQVGQDLKKVVENIELIENSLANTAALISKMNLFITNDSGLGHIASCFDVDILTIFSKNTHANPNKIFPYSKKSHKIDFKKLNNKNTEVGIVQENIIQRIGK